MTIAILHYHLRPGGVTRVIEGQSQALTAAGVEHVVLSGSSYQGESPLPTVLDHDLDYRAPQLAPADLLERLETAATERLGAPPDLWHFHNHALGKNTVLSEIVPLLARRGTPLVLQMHDFAEDARPQNFRVLQGIEELYPVAPHVHYAFINSRDRQYFRAAGLPSTQAHALPNAITPPALEPFKPLPPPTVLYPVRGIRRKNLGELCLIAALAPAGTRFAVSLVPENTQWRPIHDRWAAFAAELNLPVEFGVVGRLSPAEGVPPTFENWLRHSSHFITTSIAEGFGLGFLEPLALGKPLLGRDLPEITKDFKESGLVLGNLYEKIPIPLEMLDEGTLREILRDDLTAAYESYQRPLPPGLVERTWQTLTGDGTIDFGNLPEGMQEVVIQAILSSPETIPLAAWIREALAATAPASPPSELDSYQLISYQERILSLYELANGEPAAPPQFLSRQTVLLQFLQSERFHFLRS